MARDITDPLPLLPDAPEGAAIRDAFLADERATLVALAAQATVPRATARPKPSRCMVWTLGWRRCSASQVCRG